MSNGRFGIHGGQYIPETLMNAVLELASGGPGAGRLSGAAGEPVRDL